MSERSKTVVPWVAPADNAAAAMPAVAPDVAPRPSPAVEPPAPPPRRRRSRLWWWFAPVLGIGLFFMLLVPTMCRSSESANKIKCASNLRQLGLYLQTYANAHDGVLPVSWQDLATADVDVTADMFICASSADDRDPNAKYDDPAAWAGTLDDPAAHHCSYRYAGNGLKRAHLTADDILAFEPATNHGNYGINVLYGDAHVEWSAARTGQTPAYDRLLADYAAGVRPLRWKQ